MGVESRNLPLSRGQWTLARYLAERSPAPMPPVARAGDDALHVAKLAVGASIPRAVYVLDEDDRYLGTITDAHLAHDVFEHLDPSLYLEQHARATTALLRLSEDASRMTARSLMKSGPLTIHDDATLADAVSTIYRSGLDEIPVINREGQLVGVVRALDILREWVEDTLLVQLGDETESFY